MKLLAVPSRSRYSLQVERFGSERKAQESFRSPEVFDRVYKSHLEQKSKIDLVRRAIGSENVVDRSRLAEKINDYDIFAILGGDNHFTYCSQIVANYTVSNNVDKFLTGVVLDSRSYGGLLQHDVYSLIDSLDTLDRSDVREWSLIEGKIQNHVTSSTIMPAVSEVFVGEENRLSMSRNQIVAPSKFAEFSDKSSGILIATGAGSGEGSWYHNSSHQPEIGRNDRRLGVYLTESGAHGFLLPGERLIVDSYNDGRGIVSSDAHEDYSAPFKMGDRAEIWLSDRTLKVLTPNSDSI